MCSLTLKRAVRRVRILLTWLRSINMWLSSAVSFLTSWESTDWGWWVDEAEEADVTGSSLASVRRFLVPLQRTSENVVRSVADVDVEYATVVIEFATVVVKFATVVVEETDSSDRRFLFCFTTSILRFFSSTP